MQHVHKAKAMHLKNQKVTQDLEGKKESCSVNEDKTVHRRSEGKKCNLGLFEGQKCNIVQTSSQAH